MPLKSLPGFAAAEQHVLEEMTLGSNPIDDPLRHSLEVAIIAAEITSMRNECPVCRSRGVGAFLTSPSNVVDYLRCRDCSHTWNVPKRSDKPVLQQGVSKYPRARNRTLGA